jgi:hypothetical protein
VKPFPNISFVGMSSLLRSSMACRRFLCKHYCRARLLVSIRRHEIIKKKKTKPLLSWILLEALNFVRQHIYTSLAVMPLIKLGNVATALKLRCSYRWLDITRRGSTLDFNMTNETKKNLCTTVHIKASCWNGDSYRLWGSHRSSQSSLPSPIAVQLFACYSQFHSLRTFTWKRRLT